jgi:hypothetical protein
MMSGSQGTLHHTVNARLVYPDVDERRDFDVGNIANYDVILGTPWLFQHSVRLSFNPSSVYIESKRALPMEGSSVIQLNSISTDIFEARIVERIGVLLLALPPMVASRTFYFYGIMLRVRSTWLS